MRPVAVALLLLAALTGCAAPEPAAPQPLPGVVSSVETTIPGGTALTISQGDRSYLIFNVLFGQAGSTGGTCPATSDTGVARTMLVGRTVATTEYFQRWDDPDVPSGYTPAKLQFETPTGDDDLRQEFSQAAAQARVVACPNTERAPLSTTTVEPGPGGVYVDRDDDGESRFCSRHWWC